MTIKKTIIPLLGSLLLCGAASASTIQLDCGGVSSGAGNATLVATNIYCVTTSLVIPSGYHITEIDLLYQDDYSSGAFGSNSFPFTWTNVPADFNASSTLAETVSGGTGSNTYSPYGAYLGNAGVWLVGSDTSNFSPYLNQGSPGVLVGTVASSGGGSLSSGGTLTADAFLLIQDAPDAPEPATFSLIGGALLGLGMMLRRKTS